MKFSVGLCLPLFSVFMLGCSHFANRKAPPLVFRTDKVWIHQTTGKDNLAFRKINRMKPLLYRDWVLQANALDGVVAVDKGSGQEIWRAAIPHGVEASAAHIKDRLFLGGNDGQFYSMDAESGKILWTFPTRIETLAEPLLNEGKLYFLTGNNSLYAVDAATGKQLWLYSRQDPSSLSIRGGSRPALRNGTLYVGFSDGALVALMADTGLVKWEKQLNRNKRFKDLDSNPVIEGDFLYVIGFDDAIYCLRAATGEVVWKYGEGGYGTPLVYGNKVFYATTNNTFVALDKETGVKAWSYSLADGIATSASMYKGLLVFGESQGALQFVETETGKVVSSFVPGRGIMSEPMVDEQNDSVFFISGEAHLYHLRVGWRKPEAFPYLR